MSFKSVLGCKLVLLCMVTVPYAQDAGSPSAGGSVTADLGSPISVDERIQQQAKRLEQLRSVSAELKLGDIDELKKAYVKTRKSGVDISPEDFLAFRMALDRLSQFKATPLFAGSPQGEVSAAKLNEVSMVTLITDKSPTAALMDTFKMDKKNAETEWKQAKQTVKEAKKKGNQSNPKRG